MGSIEVVTQSQFEQLEAAIKELKSIAGPIPIPELPDNQKLRSDLAKGSASLSDTMQAMQALNRLFILTIFVFRVCRNVPDRIF